MKNNKPTKYLSLVEKAKLRGYNEHEVLYIAKAGLYLSAMGLMNDIEEVFIKDKCLFYKKNSTSTFHYLSETPDSQFFYSKSAIIYSIGWTVDPDILSKIQSKLLSSDYLRNAGQKDSAPVQFPGAKAKFTQEQINDLQRLSYLYVAGTTKQIPYSKVVKEIKILTNKLKSILPLHS